MKKKYLEAEDHFMKLTTIFCFYSKLGFFFESGVTNKCQL